MKTYGVTVACESGFRQVVRVEAEDSDPRTGSAQER
jgi:hypothetical protein